MLGWTSLKWLSWVSLYIIPIVFLPWAISRTWVHQHGRELHLGPARFYKRGELGLPTLILAVSVIWNLLQSQFMPHTIALGSVMLGFGGMMAVAVWVETFCRQSSGTDWHPERAWRDSKSLALLVFSMAAVMEILLDRFTKVVGR